MKIFVEMRPAYRITASRETVETLIVLSKYHYDFHCRSYSRGTGFLQTWLKMIDSYGEDDISKSASWENFDTLLKICEQTSYLREDQRGLVREFEDGVRRAMETGRRMMVSEEEV